MSLYKLEEIPTNDLRALGLLDNEKINLDKNTMDDLLNGKLTDFIKLENIKIDEKDISLDAKLSLRKKQDGNIGLFIHPIYNQVKNHPHLTGEEANNVIDNGVGTKTISAYGKLLDYGNSPYLKIDGNTPSFFVELEKKNGQTKTIWGKELQEALGDFKKGDNVQILHNGIEKVNISTSKIVVAELDSNTKMMTEIFRKDNVNNTDVYSSLKTLSEKMDNVSTIQVGINDRQFIFEKKDFNSKESFDKLIAGALSEERIVDKNLWKVEDFDENKKQEKVFMYEYDNETKSFVGVDTADLIVPEEINGVKLTPQQKREFVEGKAITLGDETKIQASPKDNFRSNKRMLIASVLFDGGISFVLYMALKTLINKGVKEAQIKNAHDKGYMEALKKIQADLETKQKKYPDDKKITNDLNIVKKEITSISATPQQDVKEEKNINSMKEKVNDPELDDNAERVEKEMKLDKQEQKEEKEETQEKKSGIKR